MRTESRTATCLPDRVKEGLAIRLESVVTELKVAGISQVAETKKHDVRPLRGAGEFVGPTAAELVRLIPTADNPISAETNQRTNCFASLLNRGSSLE
jgi:hypothetical protein